jgi:hypothetical protein
MLCEAAPAKSSVAGNLVVRPQQTHCRTVYSPKDILIAFEVKKRGISDAKGLEKMRCDFAQYCGACDTIRCAYVTLTERHWSGQATSENLGHPVYTLFREMGSKPNLRFDPTGDWEKLIAFVFKAAE